MKPGYIACIWHIDAIIKALFLCDCSCTSLQDKGKSSDCVHDSAFSLPSGQNEVQMFI